MTIGHVALWTAAAATTAGVGAGVGIGFVEAEREAAELRADSLLVEVGHASSALTAAQDRIDGLQSEIERITTSNDLGTDDGTGTSGVTVTDLPVARYDELVDQYFQFDGLTDLYERPRVYLELAQITFEIEDALRTGGAEPASTTLPGVSSETLLNCMAYPPPPGQIAGNLFGRVWAEGVEAHDEKKFVGARVALRVNKAGDSNLWDGTVFVIEADDASDGRFAFTGLPEQGVFEVFVFHNTLAEPVWKRSGSLRNAKERCIDLELLDRPIKLLRRPGGK